MGNSYCWNAIIASKFLASFMKPVLKEERRDALATATEGDFSFAVISRNWNVHHGLLI